MKTANMIRMKAMYWVMSYIIHMPTHGLTLQPSGQWDSKDKEYEFTVYGKSDRDYIKDPNNRKSISRRTVFLNDVPVAIRSKQQACVTLSTMEAELYVTTTCAQDMLFVYRLMKSIGLKVKLPMILVVDNKETVDLINNWNTRGRTRHIEVR